MASKIKKGDQVLVISGRDKGKTGKVIEVVPKDFKLLVSGINIVKKSNKSTNSSESNFLNKESYIDSSNVSLYADDLKPSRVGFKFLDGVKVRYLKKSGKIINEIKN